MDRDPYWIRIRIGIQPKMLDPDPDEMNADPQPWFNMWRVENPPTGLAENTPLHTHKKSGSYFIVPASLLLTVLVCGPDKYIHTFTNTYFTNIWKVQVQQNLKILRANFYHISLYGTYLLVCFVFKLDGDLSIKELLFISAFVNPFYHQLNRKKNRE